MNFSSIHFTPVRGLAAAAGLGAVVMAALAVPPKAARSPSPEMKNMTMESLDPESLNETIPSANTVLAKHLFVPTRQATGLNSYPDLIVKGVFIGRERSAVFSLKSKPQANLRIWLGDVEHTLNSVTDPRDPRQPIVQFLREWPVKSIAVNGVTVEHFITGEAETYPVDYAVEKKVADDAQRGYGQGVMPQGAVKTASAKSTQSSHSGNGAPAHSSSSGARTQFMADRVSMMMNNMSRQDRAQFLQQLNKQPGSDSKTQSANQKQSSNNSSSKKKNSKTKKK